MRKLAITTFFSFLVFDITQLAAAFCINFQKCAEKWASEYNVNMSCSVARCVDPVNIYLCKLQAAFLRGWPEHRERVLDGPALF